MRSRTQILVAVLAVAGAVIVAVQVWGYTAWLLSPDFAPLKSAQPPPDEVRASVALAQWGSVVGTVLWLTYVMRDWRRRRELTWPVLLTVAWALTFWQEPLVNARSHTFSFNRGFINRGDWTAQLPFVQHSSPLPEAILMEGLVFVYLLPLIAVGTAALACAARRHIRTSSPVLLVLVVWFAVALFDMVFERYAIAHGLLAYVEIGGPAIDEGEPSQWPIYEGLAIGIAWALPGIVMFFRRCAADPARREIAPRWWHGRHSVLVTLLAAVGLVNLVFGIYNTGYVLIMDGTVATIPPWL